jgi:hypothetical protein
VWASGSRSGTLPNILEEWTGLLFCAFLDINNGSKCSFNYGVLGCLRQALENLINHLDKATLAPEEVPEEKQCNAA